MSKKKEYVRKIIMKLANTIEAAANSQDLTENDLLALERDRKFVSSAIKKIDSDDHEEINALWTDVQNISRFFGGDYFRYSMPNELENLTESLFNEMLELVSETRRIKREGS